MILFSSDEVRQRFHELPIERQSEWTDVAEGYLKRGFQLRILFIEQTPEALEVSIRVDKKFD